MDDYIKRSDAIKETREPWITRAELRRRVCNIPPADVRPVVRHKWQTLDTEFAGRAFVCPCGFIGTEKTNFCPDCGADMTGGADG